MDVSRHSLYPRGAAATAKGIGTIETGNQRTVRDKLDVFGVPRFPFCLQCIQG